MRIAPTLDRSLRVDVENATDWLVLEMICTDACQMPEEPLADRLAHFMSRDADWNELITPELADSFNKQVLHVSRTISSTTKTPELTGSFFISQEDADIWFGAINQARLSLEARYNISQYEQIDLDSDVLDAENPNLKGALIRYHFYTKLQHIMLEYILD